MTADPYPASLAEIDDAELGFAAPQGDLAPLAPNGYLTALNRIATALERLASIQPVQNAPQQPRAPLTALPPVQTVATTPPCPYHGIEKVRPSTNGKGGFYCASKAGAGQPSNAKGYCTWHS